MKIAVIGTPYIALAIGISLANNGHTVIFIDSIENLSEINLFDVEYYKSDKNIKFSTSLKQADTCDIVINATEHDLDGYYENVIDIANEESVNDAIMALLMGANILLE